MILTARSAERLQDAARTLGALRTSEFGVTDFERLKRFFDELPTPIDHILSAVLERIGWAMKTRR